MAMAHGTVRRSNKPVAKPAPGGGVQPPENKPFANRANKPLAINPAAIANVAQVLRSSGIMPGGVSGPGGGMMRALGGGGVKTPGAPQMSTMMPGAAGAQMAGGDSGGAGGGDAATAIANLKGQLGMDPGKPSPMQSLPSSINGRAGLSPAGLPPRLQSAVDAGRMTAGGAANRYSQFQAGQLPGQKPGAQVMGGDAGTQVFGSRFDKPMGGAGMPGPGDVNQTPPIFAGGQGGGVSGLKPTQNPGVQVPGMGTGLTAAPQGSPMSLPPQFDFATGGGLQTGGGMPNQWETPGIGGQMDFQTGGGLQGDMGGGFQSPPIANIPGMDGGMGGMKGAYMNLLRQRMGGGGGVAGQLGGQGIRQQW